MIYRLLLNILHCLLHVQAFIRHLAAMLCSFPVSHKYSLSSSRLHAKSLERLPIHVGIILAEDISFTDLANVLLWCMTLGISYISVYDVSGENTF